MKEILTFIVVLWVVAQPTVSQLNSVLPVVYPKHIGNLDQLRYYFQFAKATFGWAKVYTDKSGKEVTFRLSSDPKNDLDLGSVLHRSYPGKGVLLHFQNNKIGDLAKFIAHIKPMDRPTNVLRLPVVHGPQSDNANDLIDPEDFARKNAELMTKIAFGFKEAEVSSKSFLQRPSTVKPPSRPATGYTKTHIKAMADLMVDICKPGNITYLIAFNAYYVGAAEEDLVIDFYKNFRYCRMMLYGLPNQPPINVRRVRELLTDKMLFTDMLILVPGRHFNFRIMSKDNVAWGYSAGHEYYKELGHFGLSMVLENGATLVRLNIYNVLEKDKPVHPYFTFIETDYKNLERNNFIHEHAAYLAQIADRSRAILLHPSHWVNIGYLVEMFSSFSMPFLEARVFRGPNALDEGDKAMAEQDSLKEFLMVGDNKWDALRTKVPIIFSFVEGNHGEYGDVHIAAVLPFIEEMQKGTGTPGPGINNMPLGLMLEVGFMLDRLNFRKLMALPMMRYIFLKWDRELPKDQEAKNALIAEMKKWITKFDDKILVLVFNDDQEKLNLFYREFLRKDPEHPYGTTLESEPPALATTPNIISSTASTEEPTPESPPPDMEKKGGAELMARMDMNYQMIAVTVLLVGQLYFRLAAIIQ